MTCWPMPSACFIACHQEQTHNVKILNLSKDIERSALCITLGLEIAIKSNPFYFYHLKIHVTRESATSSLWEWKTSSNNRIWFRVRIVQISCLCLNSNHNMSGGHFQWFWQMQSHIFISFHRSSWCHSVLSHVLLTTWQGWEFFRSKLWHTVFQRKKRLTTVLLLTSFKSLLLSVWALRMFQKHFLSYMYDCVFSFCH